MAFYQVPLRVAQSPDLPDVLIHMTGRYGTRVASLQQDIAILPPLGRVAAILFMKLLHFGRAFDNDVRVACFIQSTRRALNRLTGSRFECYGIAFHKQAVWNAGGGPVLYVRGDRWEAWKSAQLPDEIRALGVRLWPGVTSQPPGEYAPQAIASESQWMHEREWRIPQLQQSQPPWGWLFQPADVAFLVLPNEQAREQLLQNLVAWGATDVAWAANLQVAYPDVSTGSFHGAEDLWP